MNNRKIINRKDFLKITTLGVAALSGVLNFTKLNAEEKTDTAAINENLKKVTGKSMAEMKEDGITLQAPPIAESGAEVPVKVDVSLPVEQVKSIHVFVDNNPSPHIIGMTVSALSGRAYLDAMIRFAKSSSVRAVAVMKDGSAIIATKSVKVTVGGCG